MVLERSAQRRYPPAAVMLVSAALLLLAGTAHAQQVVVIVNGEPITALDIEQRPKLTQLSTHSAAARMQVLEELITEILEVREGKRWSLEGSDTEVETSFAGMARRMRLTPDQLTQLLAKGGVNVTTLKTRIRADI